MNPLQFYASFQFRWMMALLSMTYITSNLSEYIQITVLNKNIVKLALTFTVNTYMSILKDKALMQHFGKKNNFKTPVISILLFFTRDLGFIASAFILPSILQLQISHLAGLSNQISLTISLLLTPALALCILIILHLLGLDFYNREH